LIVLAGKGCQGSRCPLVPRRSNNALFIVNGLLSEIGKSVDDLVLASVARLIGFHP
jgi:hypothetical protein